MTADVLMAVNALSGQKQLRLHVCSWFGSVFLIFIFRATRASKSATTLTLRVLGKFETRTD